MSDRMESVTPGADDDEATVQLLRAAGPRAAVSTLRAERVRSAAHAAWRSGIRRRNIRRRVAIAGALLGAAALVLVFGRGVLLEREAPGRLGDPVAVVDQVDGRSPIQRNDVVRTGEWMETGRDFRVALRFGDGASVRLDTGSRVRALSSRIIELSAGAVYVDTGREGGRFEVRTAMATARDIGTQFEVRLLGKSLRLRVRTGTVQLTDRARSISGHQGTEITLAATGALSRPFDGHDTAWEWTTRVAPPLDMEGMALASFLERVARELGWTVVYPDPTLAREAEAIVLHGSVSGLAPHQAIEVAVAASGLRYRVERGSLVVLRADAPHTTGRDTSP